MPELIHACWKCGYDVMIMSSFQLKEGGETGVKSFHIQCPRCGLRSGPRIALMGAIHEWNFIPEGD